MTEIHSDDPRIQAFWQDYVASLTAAEAAPPEPPPAWHFTDQPDDADKLGALVVSGIKTATSSLYWGYAAESEALPQPGDLSIIINWAGEPLCLIRTTQVHLLPFNQVDAQFAVDEGDGSLDNWRQVHWAYYSRMCKAIGQEPAEDMPVVCERFEVLYRPSDPPIQTGIKLIIQEIEEELEQALKRYEQTEDLENALKAYWALEERLLALELNPGEAQFQAQQRVLAAVLMREANILRQFGRREKAAEVSICELEAARLSGDDLTLARSLVSYGATLIFSGDVEPGLEYLEEARQAFTRGDSYDHRQGLGWYWILHADLANAHVTSGGATEALGAARQALSLLEPLENWPGIGRAYAAQAIAYEALGDTPSAESARQAQSAAEEHMRSGE